MEMEFQKKLYIVEHCDDYYLTVANNAKEAIDIILGKDWKLQVDVAKDILDHIEDYVSSKFGITEEDIRLEYEPQAKMTFEKFKADEGAMYYIAKEISEVDGYKIILEKGETECSID